MEDLNGEGRSRQKMREDVGTFARRVFKTIELEDLRKPP